MPGSDSGTADGPFVDYERPFTMSGHLAGYASPDFTGPALFDLSLSGSGMATLSLAVEEGRSIRSRRSTMCSRQPRCQSLARC